jgi:hypothetical protein
MLSAETMLNMLIWSSNSIPYSGNLQFRLPLFIFITIAQIQPSKGIIEESIQLEVCGVANRREKKRLYTLGDQSLIIVIIIIIIKFT